MSKRKGKTYSLKDFNKREVNLLPADYYKASRLKVYTILMIALIIVSIGAFGYYEYNLIQETNLLKEDAQLMRTKIAINNNKISNQKVIESIDSRIVFKQAILDLIHTVNRPMNELIQHLENSLNGEIYLSSMTVNSTESMVISASATSVDAISYTIGQLKLIQDANGNKYFDDVTTQGVVRNESEDGNVVYLFQLNCEFGGGILDEIK